MDTPLFTIGIPTYNRPELLLQAIASALNQSYPNVEVVVSDNASDADIESLVSAVGDSRIRVFRNASNLGSARNFVGLVEHARGEYFSWLQDDDLLHRDFVSRAVQQMKAQDACVYVCGAHVSASVNCVSGAYVYAPPFSLDWTSPKTVPISAERILGFSLFVSITIPPAMAFQLGALKKSAHQFLDDGHILFTERTILAHLATHAKVIADPVIGATIRDHDGQLWRSEAQKPNARKKQWASSALCLDRIANSLGDTMIIPEDIFRDIPSTILLAWYREALAWDDAVALCGKVLAALKLEIAARQRRGEKIFGDVIIVPASPAAALLVVKKALRRLLPPLCWDALSQLKRIVSARG